MQVTISSRIFSGICICFSYLLFGLVAADKSPQYFGVSISTLNYTGISNSLTDIPCTLIKLDGPIDFNSSKDASIVVYGFFQDANETGTGWGVLELHTNPSSPSELQSYGSGYLEGYLTRARIVQYNQNISPRSRISDAVSQFIDENNKFLSEQIKNNPNDPFWYQTSLTQVQVSGVAAGFNASCAQANEDEANDCSSVQEYDIFLLQILTDLDDLIAAIENDSRINEKGSRCSALIRVLPDFSDLFVTHTTWYTYSSMVRVWKLYDFNFKLSADSDQIVPSPRVSFDSYPGAILSGNDFYVTSQQLTIIETTTGYRNNTLNQYVQPKTVFYWQRNIVANRLATSASSWVDYFSSFNSGTYNNEWLVVDFKLFDFGSSELKPNLLWIADQIPGSVVAKDMTNQLSTNGFVGSFNIPIFESVRSISGFSSSSYDNAPRNKIFNRNATLTNSLDDIKRLIRYNNYALDPLSLGQPTNQIAARADLSVFPQAFGATDAKISNAISIKGNPAELLSYSQMGPTHDQQKPFSWLTASKSIRSAPHVGQPDTFEFDWTENKFTN